VEQRGLIFPFAELRSECETLKTYASEVLDKHTVWVLDQARSDLESIQGQGSSERTVPWAISERNPLCTIWSVGESQPENSSKHRIRAKLSFVWKIRPLREKKEKTSKYFLLDGLASTRIALVEEGDQSEHCLAQWTVDVGDHQSPGTHFHFQLIGVEEPPFFPKSLDIPRFPTPVMSPFLAMDFVIGELFQDRWARHSAAESPDSRRWRNLHQERLKRFFEWQKECVTQCTGSPWMALKRAKPPHDLFVA
jgi:hypothetical protein